MGTQKVGFFAIGHGRDRIAELLRGEFALHDWE
jgi:hypothetical protein